MYHLHTHCRACDYGKPGAQGIKSAPTDKLIEVFDLGVQSLANDFVHDGEPHAGYAPLKVLFCPQCSLAQLSVVVDPKVLYSHYSYVTSPSQMMRDHFIQILSDIKDEAPEAKTVLEIGSNDGRLLHLMRNNGYSVQGIDPAHNLAEIARATGVPTQTGLFGEDLARMFPDYDIIIARHVFCHVDDWHDFIRGLGALCHQETLIFIEVPYVGDTLEKCEFDTVYHEHTSYLSIRATKALLKGTSLKIHCIKKYSIHGGAIGIMLRTTESTAPIMGNTWTDNFTVEYWKAFAVTAKEQIWKLTATVRSLTAQGKRVAGLGASAKSTVWISACGFTRKDIAFIADNTPQKQYTFSPGTDIPVVDEGAILRELPDYVVMWAWNYRLEILEKFELARKKGVKFIIPVPAVEIV
jgi:novobiocin biosynthesis protein NovU/D-mycarose 3-C-methyltransferase